MVPEVRATYRPCDVLVFGFDRLTLQRVQFASKYTCRLLFRVGLLTTRRHKKLNQVNQVKILNCSARDRGFSNNNFYCYLTQQISIGKGCKIARRFKWSEVSQIKFRFWTR